MKKLTKKKKIILSSVLGVVILVGGWLGYTYRQIHHVSIDKSNEALGISTTPTKVKTATTAHAQTQTPKDSNQYDNQIINIALFGVDRRNMNERGRADSTMILTVDFKHKKIKLSSLMRDMYVNVDGHGKTKFTHSYAYGGAPLAIKTINQTFGTNIRDYVTVDFFTLEKIIDEVGGVDIDVKEEEVPEVNNNMVEVAKIEKQNFVKLTHAGLQHLNGKQAVAYARIRHVGNGDFERTERQRKVLSQMIEKMKGINKAELPSFAMKILPYIETSLDTKTIMDMGMQYLSEGINQVQQDRFPRDGEWQGVMLNNIWYMQFNEEETKNQLQNFIYEPDSPIVNSSTKETLGNESASISEQQAKE